MDLTFELSSKQGALLVTDNRTYSEDMEGERRAEAYAKTHYKSWVGFARVAGYGDVTPILVTGADLTQNSASLTYSGNTTRISCDFSTICGDGDGLWGSWRTDSSSVHTSYGQGPLSAHGIRSTPGSSFDKCVFIRYLTMRKRFLIPRILKAGAGPHQTPKGNGGNDDAGVVVGISDSDHGPAEASSLETDPNATHSAPSVSPERHTCLPLLTKLTKDDRDGFDIVADFIFQVRTSSRQPLILSSTSTEN